MIKNWYAIFTRSACEKKVVAQLAKKNLNYYLPINCIIKEGNSREKLLYEPLFPSCVFVQTAEENLIKVKKIDEVISLLYWLNKPAIIKAEEMERMQRFLYEHKQVTATKIAINMEQAPHLCRDIMRLEEEGILKRGTTRLILPSLGYILATRTETIKMKEADPGIVELFHANPLNSLN